MGTTETKIKEFKENKKEKKDKITNVHLLSAAVAV